MNNIKAKSLVAGLVAVTLVSSWCRVTPLAKDEPIIIVQDKLEEEVSQKEPAMVAIHVVDDLPEVKPPELAKINVRTVDNLVAGAEKQNDSATITIHVEDSSVDETEQKDTEYVEENHDCEEYAVGDNLTATYEEAEAKRIYEDVLTNSKATYDVPYSGGAKPWNITYMSYTAVTKKSSPQYKILNSDICYTDDETGIRMVNGMYCIAIGTGFHAPVGTVVALVTEEDVIPCVVSDIKADCHTDATHTYCTGDGSVVEFVIDKDVFKGSEMYPDELEHNVKQIAVYDTMI